MGGAAPQQQAAGSVVAQGLATPAYSPAGGAPAASGGFAGGAGGLTPDGRSRSSASCSRGRPSTSSSTAARGRSRTTITIWSRSSPSATRRRLCRRRGGGHGQGPARRGSADARRSIWDPSDGPGPDSCCTWQVMVAAWAAEGTRNAVEVRTLPSPIFAQVLMLPGVDTTWPTNPQDVFLDPVLLAGAATPWAANPSQSHGNSFRDLVKIGGTWSLPSPTAQGGSIRSGSAGLGSSMSSSSVNSIMCSFFCFQRHRKCVPWAGS